MLIIGLFDLLAAGKVAIAEPIWAGYSTEVYLLLAAIYFLFCFTMARLQPRVRARVQPLDPALKGSPS